MYLVRNLDCRQAAERRTETNAHGRAYTLNNLNVGEDNVEIARALCISFKNRRASSPRCQGLERRDRGRAIRAS